MAGQRARIGGVGINVNRLRLYVGLAAGVLAVLYFFREREPSCDGIPLVALGLGIRLWAAGHLSKNAALTTSGPYGYVRHPLYLGTMVAFLGIPFIVGVYWLAFVVVAVVLPPYYWRIALEERELGRRFGDAYEAYRRAVPALIPLPWRRFKGAERGRFSWRRAIVENRWHRGCLYTVLALLAADLFEDVLYPAVALGRPLSGCLHELLDFTRVFHTGHL